MTWNYSNTATETTLSAPVSSGATTISVGVTTGFPLTVPYSLTLDYGQPTAEVVTVTAVAGTSLTVTRGADSTLAQAHSAGARVVHTVVARDLREPQQHMAATSDVHGIGSSSSVVGTVATQTLTNKTMSGANNTFTSLPANQLTGTFPAISSSGSIAATTGVSGTTGTFTGAISGASAAITNAVTSATVTTTGNVAVGNNLAVTGTATVTGNATANGTLTVAGQTQINDDLLSNSSKYMSTPDTAASAKSYPRGIIDPVTTSTPSQLGITASTPGTAVSVISVSFAFPVAGRYEIDTGIPVWGDVNTQYRWDLYVDAVRVDQDVDACVDGAHVAIKKCSYLYTAAAGSKTIEVKLFRVSASGALNSSAGTAFIRVKHVGD